MHYSEFLAQLKTKILEQVDSMQHQYESQMKANPTIFLAEQTEEVFEDLFNSMYG